ncbi:hypothetical protein [Paenibacillus sp. DMB5]|nr:hypothetical protein [Paenibacillus sp. DMB5]
MKRDKLPKYAADRHFVFMIFLMPPGNPAAKRRFFEKTPSLAPGTTTL